MNHDNDEDYLFISGPKLNVCHLVCAHTLQEMLRRVSYFTPLSDMNAWLDVEWNQVHT